MSTFKKVSIPRYPVLDSNRVSTPDSLYWRENFVSPPIVAKEYGAISHVEFSPSAPHDFAVTNSTRVQIYDSRSLTVTRTLQRFQRQALSGSFRGDGGLVVAGTEDGFVKVFDHHNQSLLRTFKDVHSGPVHVTRFLRDNLHVISGGDDRRVQMLDVPAESVVHTFVGDDEGGGGEFRDYIRAGAVSPAGGASSTTFAMASYDHRAKIFDARVKRSVLSMDHGRPIDACCFLLSGSILLTAGGVDVSAWDLVAGGRLLKTFSFHHKSITCLCLASAGRRVLSGGLDKHVKVYDSRTFDAVASIDYPSPILSIAVSPDDDRHLVVGMTDGLVSIKRRRRREKSDGGGSGGVVAEEAAVGKDDDDDDDDVFAKKKSSAVAAGSKKTDPLRQRQGRREQQQQQRRKKGGLQRGGGGRGQARPSVAGGGGVDNLDKADQIVRRSVKDKLKLYDYYFRKFEHSKALDVALKLNTRVKTPEVTLAVMEELMRRQRLRAAVAGRSDRELAILLVFLSKNFSNVNFNATVMDVIDVLVEVYMMITTTTTTTTTTSEGQTGRSGGGGGGGKGRGIAGPVFDEENFPESVAALKQLKENVASEVMMKKRFLNVVGMMEPLLENAV